MEGKKSVNVIKAEQKSLRHGFTIIHTKFEKASQNADSEEMEKMNFLLKEKFEKLKINHSCFLNEYLGNDDKEEVIKEIEKHEEYEDKMAEASWKFKKLMSNKEKIVTNCTEESRMPVDNYKLPKLTLIEFDLCYKTWLPFWSQYKVIYNDANLRVNEKFQYLLMSLKDGTKARDMLIGYPQDEESLAKAVNALKDRFGRDDVLIEVYTRELLSIILNKNYHSLSSLYDKISVLLRALSGLGMTTNNSAFVFYPLVESCLPNETRMIWDREKKRASLTGSTVSLSEERPIGCNPLDDLMLFLAEEVKSEERILMGAMDLRPITSTAAAMASTSSVNYVSKPKACIFCSKGHSTHECLKNISLKEMEDKLLKEKACFKCLKRNHRSSDCRTFVRCLICNKQHYTIMCKNRNNKNESSDKPFEEEKGQVERNYENKEKILACLGVDHPRATYLKTLLVKIVKGNKEVAVRVLVDDGAHRNYIATSVVEKLRLKPESHEHISHGLFGGQRGPTKKYDCFNLKIKGMLNEKEYEIQALGQDVICDQIAGPSLMRDKQLFVELKNKGIVLTDVGDNNAPIELLLGAEALGYLLTGNMHVLKNGVTAIETKLGWSVIGNSSRTAKTMLCLNALSLPKMWDLQNIGIAEPMCPKPESIAIEHFESSIKRNDEGRFIVELPWIAGRHVINENLNIAEKRLQTITDKLRKENLYTTYDDVIQEWTENNIIEEATNDNDDDIKHYLPHRHVLKKRTESSLKVRPVFDASAKQANNVSLNQCLHKGPNLIQNIPQLLLKFRLQNYGLTADIKQAFLQIIVAPKDREVLRFLWWTELGKMVAYRHCRLVFGLVCSPFLLNAVIAKLIDSEINKYPEKKEILSKLKNSYYIDDTISSHCNKDELNEFINEATSVMIKGKFELCKWTSNAPWLMNDIKTTTSVLGLIWNTQTDNMFCSNIFEQSKNLTKRKLLSQVNAIYDPIGILSPALLIPKLILQEAWKLKIGWDDELPEIVKTKYEEWATELNEIENIKIPRKVCHGDINKGNNTIHIFSDACQASYGCCIFLRHEENEQITVQLIAAKARVSPLEKHTIPRLELLGACIGVRLYNSIKSALPSDVIPTFWTDSMTVLWWITKALPWATFVGNRVKEIRCGSEASHWRHIPGTQNPAALVSRGSKISYLKQIRWWEGPEWLKENECMWPKQQIECPADAIKEMKTVMCTVKIEELFIDTLSQYFSSYLKTIRMCAWMLRFKNNNKGTLTTEEINIAEDTVIKVLQTEMKVNLKEVKTFIDENGLIRINSRVHIYQTDNALILLPNNHKIVNYLIYDTHVKLCHAGVGITLTKLREKYWIIKGRKSVGSIVRKCVYCKRFKGKPFTTADSMLPTVRTNITATAFQTTGIDLFGPLFLKDGGKVWGVLFTCAVFRCIRLDIVNSLSTESFVLSLRRFLARHSNVKNIITDNGGNFKGISNQLAEIDWCSVEQFVVDKRLKMTQNPPAAPWWGGFFERLIGVVKNILIKQLGREILEYDELITLFFECEAIVNNRPLTYISEDPRDFQPLTPNHFLQENPGDGCSDLDIVDEKSLIKRVQFVQEVRHSLRTRFKQEYLSLLVQRKTKNSTPLKIGQVVLIEGDGKKRINWPLGKIIEIYPGKDNVTRVVKLKTQFGNLIRPVQRIFPLEGVNNKEVSDSSNDHIEEPTSDIQTVSKPPVNTDNTDVMTRHGRMVRVPNRLNL